MSNRAIAITLVLTGLVIGVLVYTPWFEASPLWLPLRCLSPLCPTCVLRIGGNPVEKHARLMIVCGIADALLYSVIGWPIVIIARRIRKGCARQQSPEEAK